MPSVPKTRTEGAKRGVKCALRPEFLDGGRIRVEVGGLEPPSKQRTRWLSTCLSGLWFSYPVCGEARLSGSYPLNLGGGQGSRSVHPVWMIPRLLHMTGLKGSGILVGVAALATRIKLTYLVD